MVSSLIPCSLTSVLKSSSTVALTDMVRPEERQSQLNEADANETLNVVRGTRMCSDSTQSRFTKNILLYLND